MLVHPAAIAGPTLRARHGQWEVPRDDQQARAHGLLQLDVAGRAVRPVRVAAVDLDGLLGEPADQVGGVADLAPGLRQRLAQLQGHHLCQRVGPPDHHLVGAVQDLRAGACRSQSPRWRRLGGRSEGALRVVDGSVGHLGDHVFSRGGSAT
jgi:hypothetical protein